MLSTCRDACELVPWRLFTLVILRNLNFVQKGNLETPCCSKLLKMKVKVIQSCPTLCDPMDYTVHRILQARMLEWVAFPFSRGSSQCRDWTEVSCIAGGFFINWAIREAHYLVYKWPCFRWQAMSACWVPGVFFFFFSRSLLIEASPSYDNRLFMRDADWETTQGRHQWPSSIEKNWVQVKSWRTRFEEEHICGCT